MDFMQVMVDWEEEVTYSYFSKSFTVFSVFLAISAFCIRVGTPLKCPVFNLINSLLIKKKKRNLHQKRNREEKEN